ncbi:hypothetical protein CKK34_6566 [Yarrowia sp. E02]|nr:hypothetical protein CKK34_6566 [Yarrowia sp. E02]
MHGRSSRSRTCRVYCFEDEETHSLTCRYRDDAPAGLVRYKDTFFCIDLESRYKLRVSKAVHSLDSGFSYNNDFAVCQDEEYPQFCLVFKLTGMVVGLVDLDKMETQVFSHPGDGVGVPRNYYPTACEEHLVMAGISGGSLGIWKFSIQHLRRLFRIQHGDWAEHGVSISLSSLASKPAKLITEQWERCREIDPVLVEGWPTPLEKTPLGTRYPYLPVGDQAEVWADSSIVRYENLLDDIEDWFYTAGDR